MIWVRHRHQQRLGNQGAHQTGEGEGVSWRGRRWQGKRIADPFLHRSHKRKVFPRPNPQAGNISADPCGVKHLHEGPLIELLR